MLCKVSELFSRSCLPVKKPRAVEGDLGMARDGKADLVTADGRGLLDALHLVRLESISGDGFRLAGVQGYPPGRIRYQEWFCRPVE